MDQATPNVWDFFARKVCLTVKDSEWEIGRAEFERVGLTDVEKVVAAEDIGPHQSFNRSVRRILIDFYGSGLSNLLHLEDDCVFRDLTHLPAALAELPDDWDVLYLGANIQDPTPVKMSDHLSKINGAWTTHAIAYNRKCIPFLLENQPGFSEQMFDNWLAGQYERLNFYVVNPMIAWQRPRYSAIWQRDTNYDDVFSEAQWKLNSGNIHVVTFSDQNMRRSGENLEGTARIYNIPAVWHWTREELERTEFYLQNKTILDQPRGCGYWLWKPYIILNTLNARCQDGEYLIYADAGVEFINDPRTLIAAMDQDVLLFGNHWEHVHWCKGDVLHEVLPSWPYKKFGKQVQASAMIFRVSDWSRWFVGEWLRICLMPGMIDDSPSRFANHKEFAEHRHDQAVLTTLAYRENIRLHWWPASYNDGANVYEKQNHTDSYPVVFNHHRKRNGDWP